MMQADHRAYLRIQGTLRSVATLGAVLTWCKTKI